MKEPIYSVERLLTDDSFLSHILGTDQEAKRIWENRIRERPEEAAIIEEAAQLVRLMTIKPEPITDSVIEEEVLKLESRLSFRPVMRVAANNLEQDSPTPPGSRSTWWKPWYSVAASILFLFIPAIAGWIVLSKPDNPTMLAIQTQAGESTVVMLPDSSIAFLSGSSTLRYAQDWQAHPDREVWLEGEAFFHVKPQPVPGGVKFRVHAANATVEVLGTRFNVVNREQKTRVVLSSGKVKVNITDGSEQEPVFMEPGEMVEVSADHPAAVLSRVELMQNPARKEKKIVFEDAPMRKIALVVEEYYGLKVKLQDPSIGTMRISGTLPTANEESFFRALSVILDLKITKGKNQEVIFARNHSR